MAGTSHAGHPLAGAVIDPPPLIEKKSCHAGESGAGVLLKFEENDEM
jgi:hypothetical protein